MKIKEFKIYSDKNILKGNHYEANLKNKRNKVILMCHGFAGIQDLFFPKYAEKFSLEGFDVITFDYNGFGKNEGETEIIPSNQIRDISNVILYLKKNEEFRDKQLYLWGTSLGGLYVLKLAATLPGISGVYAQITFSNGIRNNTSLLDFEGKEKYLNQLENIRYKEILENKKLLLPLKRLLSDSQSKVFLEKYKEEFSTLLSTKLSLATISDINELSIDSYLDKINVPVLLLKANNDIVNLPQEMDFIYKVLKCDKKLLEYDCGHYDVYEDDVFLSSIVEQIKWFSKEN
ncbi:alpha/beta fold hydrolase [Cetobacterium sp.]|uniref:alpha/beta hydrolase n=1 Tax=Cetobacterium sp. TaxID=2071632 RepID=UPI0025C5D896|nr:alpha/beta fold hydrolase [Cetobacterium sp.]